jgi:hypothetical protein
MIHFFGPLLYQQIKLLEHMIQTGTQSLYLGGKPSIFPLQPPNFAVLQAQVPCSLFRHRVNRTSSFAAFASSHVILS